MELRKELLEILKSGKEYTIAFIGDSLTSGEWVHPNWRSIFEYILKYSFEKEFTGEDWYIPEWNIRFFNYSLDGASTNEFVKNTKRAIDEVKPDLFIIMGTANDSILDVTVDTHIKNLKGLFSLISQSGAQYIYSPDGYSNSEKSNNEYLPYLERVRLELVPDIKYYVDMFEEFKKFPLEKIFTMKYSEFERADKDSDIDPVHPNSLGCAYIAKVFLEKFFDTSVNPELFIQTSRDESIKYPKWN